MKKMVLFFAAVFMTSLAFAQSFSDDFESYNSGDMLAASSNVWRTWTNVPTIDAPISSDQAVSGSNSLHMFSQTATAPGPMDLVLDFGGKFEAGEFHFEMMMFVEGGAYFNFQGEVTEGQEWTFQPEFRADGTVTINNSDNASTAVADYPLREWFKFEVDVDLTLNTWTVSINGDPVSKFSNPNNALASLNLYPLAGHSYYIDDIAYEVTPFDPTGLDMGVAGLAVPARGLAGKEYSLGATVINIGLDEINSFDVSWTDGANSGMKSITGVNVGTLATYDVTFDEMYTADATNNNIMITLSNINGGDDDNADNNIKAADVGVIVPAPDKAVFVEEGTGTWCGWCPRGDVGMAYMEKEYGDYFVGVAVHNGANDPMLVPEYNAGVTSFPGFTGFPGSIFDRTIETDPGAANLESNFFDYIIKEPKTTIEHNVEYEGDTRTVIVDVNYNAKVDATGLHRVVSIVREDNVTDNGNGMQWSQSNFYSGGGNGEMGGFELLPNPVPANMMVYNKVGRALIGGFAGQVGVIPINMVAGETYTNSFTYTVPADQDPTQLSIISAVIAPDGTADNVSIQKYNDWAVKSDVDNVQDHVAFKGIAPNPTQDVSYINLDLAKAENVDVTLINSTGQLVSTKNYGQLIGDQMLPINASQLTTGIYFVKIRIGDEFMTRSLMVK